MRARPTLRTTLLITADALVTYAAVLLALLAVALFSVLMGKRGIAYDPKFSDDQIGIFVPAGTAPAIGARVASSMTRRLFNLVVTNVPGPQFPLFFRGGQMLDAFPVGLTGKRRRLLIPRHMLATFPVGYHQRSLLEQRADAYGGVAGAVEDLAPAEHLVDAAYVSGTTLVGSATALIKVERRSSMKNKMTRIAICTIAMTCGGKPA